jgi:hypothetical protein
VGSPVRGREATRAIREVAERQHGVVAHRQILELGVGKTLVQRRVEGGLLIPIHQGVFALGHQRINRKGLWMAAVLACGPGVLSHGSAMELWGLRRSRGAIEVLRRSGGSRRHRPGIRLHQTRALPSRDIVLEANIPVTSIERTLLDMAGRLDSKQLERAVVAADRTGHLRWPELQRVLVSGRGRKGAGRLRRVAAQVDPRAVDARSPLEVDFLALCRDSGLPLPQVNVLLEGCLVDFFWPRECVIVETDGYTFHRDRPAFERDHEQTAELEAADYLVHRATYCMLASDPAPFMRLVRGSLQRRRDYERLAGAGAP